MTVSFLTGKTLIAKIPMNQSSGITCIVADEELLTEREYIRNLYELAQDLKPSIVFIENIELVGEDRRYGISRSLFSLLSSLDGIRECDGVVTVATTNSIETIDRALKERPSRFDRAGYLVYKCPAFLLKLSNLD